MDYQFRFLSQDDLPELYQTFLEAFSDYSVRVTDNSEKWFPNRLTKNGVDFNLSVGAFDQG